MKKQWSILIFVVVVFAHAFLFTCVFADTTNDNVLWYESDFSAIDHKWSLQNGMYFDPQSGTLRVEEATGTGDNIAEANFPLTKMDLGETWNLYFRVRAEEDHQGKIEGQIIYDGYRAYWIVDPDASSYALQGAGTRKDRATKRGVWYEYLYQFYRDGDVRKLSVWRRSEGEQAWLDMFTGYTMSSVNVNTGTPAIRFLGGFQDGGMKLSFDDVRLYRGNYGKLEEPVIYGNRVVIDGVFDYTQPGIVDEKPITLIVASYDKEYGYTKEIHTKEMIASSGDVVSLNTSVDFSNLDRETDSVIAMLWDGAGCPLASATGEMPEITTASATASELVPVVAQVSYNEVSLKGYTGKPYSCVTASLKRDGKWYAVLQKQADQNGMIDTSFRVPPDAPSGTYDLAVNYHDDTQTTTVNLACVDSVGNIYSSVEEIVGNKHTPYQTFDFTSQSAAVLYTGSGFYTGGVKYFHRNYGLNIDSTTKESFWRYSPISNWFTLGDKRAVRFRTKVNDDVNPFNVYLFEPGKSFKAHHVQISAQGVSTECSYSRLDGNFKPGTAWVDYIIVKTGSGIKVYASMKERLSGRWFLVLETTGVSSSSISTIGGLHFLGTGSISSVSILNTGVTSYNSLDEITNAKITTVYDFSYHSEPLVMVSGNQKYIPADVWYPLDEGKAVGFRAKVSEASDTLTFLIGGSEGCAKLELSSVGVTANGYSGSVKKQSSFSGLQWIDCMIMQNSLGGYSVYAKCDSESGKWFLVSKTEDYPLSASASLGIEVSGSGEIGYIRQYDISNVALEGETIPTKNSITYYQEEFNRLPERQQNLRVKNASVKGSCLQLIALSDENAGYSVADGGIPLGGYTEFRIKSDGDSEFVTSDGTSGIHIDFNDNFIRVVGNTSQQVLMGSDGDYFKTWRIAHRLDGTYDGYCKADGDSGWYRVFQRLRGSEENLHPVTEFSVKSGRLLCEYLRIYGPYDGKKLILTDGYGTKMISDKETFSYYDSLRALVAMDAETVQTLIFAEYVGGALAGYRIEQVPSGSGFAEIPYSVKNSASRLKVFLWDSIGAMSAVEEAQPAKLDWELFGDAQDNDGGFSLGTGKEDVSSVELSLDPDEKLDLEWNMKIHTFNRSEEVHLYTGTHHVVMSFAENAISIRTEEGLVTMPCVLGTESHNYRVVWNRGVVYFYLDGNFMGEATGFPESTEDARFILQENGESEF